MTSEDAIQELEQLRGIADKGGDLAQHKQRIEALYLEVCRKRLRKCKCKNVLQDALFEIYSRLRQNKNIKSENMAQARLVLGVVIFWGGKHYTNKNLTDEVAREFLDKFPQRKDWFEVLPPAEVEDIPEKPSNEAAESEKVEDEPTTPKAKKSAKKRK